MSRKTKAQLQTDLNCIEDTVQHLLDLKDDGQLEFHCDTARESFDELSELCGIKNHVNDTTTLVVEMEDYDLPLGDNPDDHDSYTVEVRDSHGKLIKNRVIDLYLG